MEKNLKNKNIRILVVEDEIIASEYLQNILKKLGLSNIYEASSFEESLEVVKKNRIDLIFMDINIDGATDGINSAKILNKEYPIPVIYTTAYGDSNTIKEACDSNLYAYLIKPFEPNEVESALMIALKKIDICEHIVDLGENQRYDLATHTLTIHNEVIPLTKKEDEILHLLCKNPNQNISYDTLLEYVWQDRSVSNSTIRDTVSRLKRKVPNLKIETLINFGYILKTKLN
jgi:DNA-binding response OmpR family regulator